MSFSSDIKTELSREVSRRRHCQLAELAAMISFGGHISIKPSGCRIVMQSENLKVAKKYCTLLKKCFNIYSEIVVRTYSSQRRSRTYILYIGNQKDCLRILQALKFIDAHHTVQSFHTFVNPLLISRPAASGLFSGAPFSPPAP